MTIPAIQVFEGTGVEPTSLPRRDPRPDGLMWQKMVRNENWDWKGTYRGFPISLVVLEGTNRSYWKCYYAGEVVGNGFLTRDEAKQALYLHLNALPPWVVT